MKQLPLLVLIFIALSLTAQSGKKPIQSPTLPGSKSFPAGEEEVFHFGRLTVYHYPKKLSGIFASGFVPRGSLAIHATEYRGEFYAPREISLIFKTGMNLQQLSLYYDVFLATRDLSILQKEESKTEKILLLETRTKKLITIHITSKKGFSRVKLFYRNILY